MTITQVCQYIMPYECTQYKTANSYGMSRMPTSNEISLETYSKASLGLFNLPPYFDTSNIFKEFDNLPFIDLCNVKPMFEVLMAGFFLYVAEQVK